MKNAVKVLGVGVLVAIVLFLFDNGWAYFSGKQLEFNYKLVSDFGYFLLYSVPLSLVNSYYYYYIGEKIDWEKRENLRLRVGFFGSVLLTLVSFFLIRTFQEVFLEGKTFAEFISKERIETYIIALIITLIIVLFFHAVYFYKALQEKKVKEHKVIAKAASAQFDALKNQLDPHFLFNSLNVLTSLIEEDPYKAQKFTTSLSKVYRYVLEQKNKDLISVNEELSFAKTYVSLLKMRFEDSIVFEMPETLKYGEAKVVPLSLQLLLENAVKHNKATPENPLHITITEEGNMLIVNNNLQEKQVLKKGSGVGLENIKQRYYILTEAAVEIIKTTTDFKVKIPMLHKDIEIIEHQTQEHYISGKRYEKAKERVKLIKDFYGHLLSYCMVIPILIIVNYNTTSFPWAIFPTLGWGFGLTAHGLEAFGKNPFMGKNWQDRKIRELMDDDNF